MKLFILRHIRQTICQQLWTSNIIFVLTPHIRMLHPQYQTNRNDIPDYLKWLIHYPHIGVEGGTFRCNEAFLFLVKFKCFENKDYRVETIANCKYCENCFDRFVSLSHCPSFKLPQLVTNHTVHDKKSWRKYHKEKTSDNKIPVYKSTHPSFILIMVMKTISQYNHESDARKHNYYCEHCQNGVQHA